MAGRKEYELLFKLQAALGGNFNAAFRAATNAVKEQQNALSRLNSVVGKIDAYRKQESALESNRQKLERLTAEHERLQREISETEEPTDELREKLARNELRRPPRGLNSRKAACNRWALNCPTRA